MEAAAQLLDFNVPIDVPLLEATVDLMYGAANGDQVSGLVLHGVAKQHRNEIGSPFVINYSFPCSCHAACGS